MSRDEPFDIMRFLHWVTLVLPPALYLYFSEAPFYWWFFLYAAWFTAMCIYVGVDHSVGKLTDLSYTVSQLEAKLESMEDTLNDIRNNQS